jgi:hypothetical protein
MTMTESDLIKRLAASAGTVPAHAEVFGVRRFSLGDLERRAKRFLTSINEAYNLSLDKGDWTQKREQTLIRLPRGARALLYHASGAMKFVSGLAPMERLFPATATQDTLMQAVESASTRLKIEGWVSGVGQTLKFERLWKIKAAGGDRNGKVIEPVICRAIGAYRQFIGEVPVLGPASVAVKIAGDGSVDSVDLQLRETTPEVIDRSAVLPAADAARQVVLQLSSLMGKGKVAYTEYAVPESMRFGYINLGKRSFQAVLAPVYLATISIAGEEAQGYVLVTSATEKPYLALSRAGHEAPAASISRVAAVVVPPAQI